MLIGFFLVFPHPQPQIAQELQRIPTKLDILYDRLNNDEVSADLAKKLRTIAKSMENRRLDEAYPFCEFSTASFFVCYLEFVVVNRI